MAAQRLPTPSTVFFLDDVGITARTLTGIRFRAQVASATCRLASIALLWPRQNDSLASLKVIGIRNARVELNDPVQQR